MAAENVLEIKINDTTPSETAAPESSRIPAPPRLPDTLAFRPLPGPPPRDLAPPPPKTLQSEQQKYDDKTSEAAQIANLIGSRVGLPPQLTQLLFANLRPQGPSPLEIAKRQEDLHRELIRETKEMARATRAMADGLRAPRADVKPAPTAAPIPKPENGFDFSPSAVLPTPAPKPTKPAETFDFSPPTPKQEIPEGFDFSPEAPSTPAPQPVKAVDTFDFSPGSPSTTPVTPAPPQPPFSFSFSPPPLPVAKPAAAPAKPPIPAPAPAAAGAAGGAASAGLAAAGGPVGLAIAAAEMVEGKVNELYAGVEKGIRGLGTVAAQVAGNDGLGALKSATGAATGAIESIPIVGKDLARNFKLIVAAQETYSQVITALTRRGQELAEYDSRLALASAEAEVSKVYADLREAQRNGETMSKLIRAQSRIEIATQDNFSRIKDTLSRALAPGLERLADVIEKVEPLLDAQLQIWDTVIEANNKVAEVTEAVYRWLNRMPQKSQDGKDAQAAEELMEGLLGMVNDLDLGGNADPVPDEWKETVSAPLFR